MCPRVAGLISLSLAHLSRPSTSCWPSLRPPLLSCFPNPLCCKSPIRLPTEKPRILLNPRNPRRARLRHLRQWRTSLLLPGFNIVEVDYLGPPDRVRAFLSALPEKSFEHVVIAFFNPPVNKSDFRLLSRELRRELYNNHWVPNIEVQPYGIGDAFVYFESPLERQRFTRGPPIEVGAYTVHFVSHDEVVNVSAVDVDREV